LLATVVRPANEHDSQAVPPVLKGLLGKADRLMVVFADSGCEGLSGGLAVSSPAAFGRRGRGRGLRIQSASEAMIRVAMIRSMTRHVN
jgi:hypothetical protein